MAVHKEMKAIAKELRKNGYQLAQGHGRGGTHVVVYENDKQVGRFSLAGSGDPGTIAKKVRAELKRNGVRIS